MVNAYLLTGKIPLTPLTTETLPRPSQKKIITVHVMYTPTQPLTFLVLSFCKLSVGDSCCCYDGYRRFFTCWRYVVSPISFSKLALKTKHPPVPSFFAGKLFLLYICHGRMKTEIKPVIKSVYCNLLRDVNTMQWNEVQVFV